MTKFEDLPVECQEDILKRNKVISEVNKFTDELNNSNIKWSAREMAQGIEVKIIRPTFGNKEAAYYRIFPFTN
jgi:hypothetical protein